MDPHARGVPFGSRSPRKRGPYSTPINTWLIARRGVTAPIASATSVGHVEGFARAVELKLTAEEIAALDAASA